MLLAKIYEILNAEIPHRLSDEYIAAYGGHDNSGILVNTGDEINGAIFSLDLSEGAIARAKESGANLIVTHHPAIFFPVSELSVGNALGRKLIDCAANGISVIAMHLNADCAPRGVDFYLAQAAGAKAEENVPVQRISEGGYGRVFSVEGCTVNELSEKVKNTLGAKRVWVFGKDNYIERVASFCGAGVDGDSMKIAVDGGAQALISSDIKYNYICEALENGMNVIQLTHYASENYGFKKIYQHIKDKLGVGSEYHDDSFML